MGRDTLKILGSTSLAKESGRPNNPNDYYGTDPRSTKALLAVEKFNNKIWEPCAGHHLIVNELKAAGYNVTISDIEEYEGYTYDFIGDFLKYDGEWDGDIVTNPPYGISTEFAVKALDILKPGRKLAMFLRLQWLEGIGRYEKVFSINPPKTVYIFSNRQASNKDDDFTVGSAVAYMWLVWEKGFKGNPEIKWISTVEPKDTPNYMDLFEE